MGRFKIQGASTVWSYIYPSEAEGQNFINPFILDPADNNKMYYLGGNTIWRQDNLAALPDYVNGTMQGWQPAARINLNSQNYFISAIAASQKKPTQRLYFAASSYFNHLPVLYRLDNAHTRRNSRGREIRLPADVPSGAFISAIAVNPQDANEILIAFSNYNIVSLYHSDNGGETFTAVEGNLAGSETLPGPSVRHAIIHTYKGKTTYLVGTSVGLFSAELLAGDATEWEQEGADIIGNAVVTMMEARPKDGAVAVSTHGRGVYWGTTDSQYFEGLDEPLELLAKDPSATGFTLEWSEVEDAAAYEVQIALDEDFTQVAANFDPAIATDNRLLIANALQPNTRYYARVRAINDLRTSFYTNTASITTLQEEEETTGLTDMSRQTGVSLYPNPASDALNLRLPKALEGEIWQMSLTDNKGAIVFRQRAITLPQLNRALQTRVSPLPQGLYFLNLQNKTHKASLRFVKE